MVNAYFGVMTKKINSTKTDFVGRSYEVLLKEPVSTQSPVFLLKASYEAFAGYNYSKFMDRFYWITDVISTTNDLLEVHCVRDPLATWKDDIKAAKGLINFGPKSLNTKSIVDSRFSPDIVGGVKGLNVNFSSFSKTGCVIMRVVDFPVGGVPGSGGVQTICGSIQSFNQLLSTYCSEFDGDFDSLTDFEKIMGKAAGLGNALDAIKSALWVPIDIDQLKDAGYGGNIGGYNIAGTWYWCKNWSGKPLVESKDITIAIPLQASTYPWLLHPKYMHIDATTPGGKLDLSSIAYLAKGTDNISLTIRFGMSITGDSFMTFIDTDTQQVINSTHWNMAIDLKDFIYKAKSAEIAGGILGAKAGMATVAAIGTAGTAISTVGELVGSKANSMTGINAAIGMQDFCSSIDLRNSTVSTGIQGIIKAIDTPVLSHGFGAPDSVAALYLQDDDAAKFCYIYITYYMPMTVFQAEYEDFCDEYGWPALRYSDMSVNGYYEMAGCSVSVQGATQAEISTINSIVNTGIYIED